MRTVLNNFLRLEVLNTHPLIYWAIAVIWAGLLVAAFLSIKDQDISLSSRLFWSGVVFLIPIFGLAAYTVWCLFRAEWTFLKPLLQSRSAAVKSVVAPPKR